MLATTTTAKFAANAFTERFWLLSIWLKYNENNLLFIYIYLFPQTPLQVRPVDGFSHSMAQITGTDIRVCLLGGGGLLILLLI